MVTPSRCMISRALPGSKRGIIVRQPPVAMVAFSEHVCPKEWNSGRAPSVIAPGPISKMLPPTSTLRRRFSWVSAAPLDRPVVPEV